MEIPIQNIYYLLCYAWNKLVERDIVDVKGIETTQLFDLFAKVLINGTSRLLKMGIDRGYVLQNDEIVGIKGKLDLSLSLKKNLFRKAKAQCQFDELSHNVLHNQILKSTIYQLANVDQLAYELKERLFDLYQRFHEVEEIQLNKTVFRRIQLHQNNSFYEFLLKVCELVIDNLLPSEQKGQSKFQDFMRDERQMAKLFEEFVRNFFRLEQSHFRVYREDILWDVSDGDEASKNFLPKMQTDISLESGDKKIIIDTKYYREALGEHYDKEKIKSQNLSQMFSYLMNLDRTKNINKDCAGILLYPTVTRELDLNVTIQGHQISFKTINLNQEWQGIEKDLLAVVSLSK
jgi:5-methylcytosine-specific restriction enzyme subunit McrC